MHIVVFNLGCKVNQYEGESIGCALQEAGHTVSYELEYADAYVLNTCSVTAEAQRKSRQLLTRAARYNPNAKLYVCGCAAQNNPSQFLGKTGVAAVLGTDKKMLLAQLDSLPTECDFSLPKQYRDDMRVQAKRARSYVKIQDGCNNFCSYCIVPYLRGRARSRALASVVAECREESRHNNEIVLTGIDISSYGKDNGTSLAALINALSDLDAYVRLGSLEVNVITDELLEATLRLKGFCPHFHLSLQSGDDAVLRSMNRHYTAGEYLDKIRLLRRYYPDATLTTDVIVGFSTESEQAFQNSLNVIGEAGFADVHFFPYSVRTGTAAAKLKPLPPEIIKARMERTVAVKEACRNVFLQRKLGQSNSFVAEQFDGEFTEGYSPDYVRIYVKGELPLRARYYVTMQSIFRDGILGTAQ